MDVDRVRSIVEECYSDQFQGVEIENDWDLIESGFIDSLELVSLVASLEAAFGGIKIPDSDATKDNLGSVDAITAYLTGRGL